MTDTRGFKWKSNALVAAHTLAAKSGVSVLVFREAKSGQFGITTNGHEPKGTTAICAVVDFTRGGGI